MNRIALDLGFIQIYWYSIFIFIAILCACLIIMMEVKKRKIDEEFFVNLIFNTIIFGIIGARIYYVLFNLSYYMAHPIEILEIWKGGLAIHGGILFGFIFIYFYCKKYKVRVLKILDIIVVGLILGQAIGRWGNFFNGEAYGVVTSIDALTKAGVPEFVINGMYVLGEYRVPTFLYESILNFIGFFALIIIRRYPYIKIGQLTGFYLMWYSITRFIIEGMRTDSLMLGNFKMAQLVSVGLFIVGIILFFYYLKKGSKLDNLYNQEEKSNAII